MKGLTYEEQVALLCFLGRYLDLHGKPKEAVECWKECQACISTPVATRTSAGAELAAHGVTTDDYRAIERKPLGLAD